LSAELRPRLGPSARLRFDARTQSHFLLSPERGLRLQGSAAAILERCDGARTVSQVVESLLESVADSSAIRDQVTSDVWRFLTELAGRRLVVFEPGA
jgi:pyrroloquinoline quinone biosynthesis protein D